MKSRESQNNPQTAQSSRKHHRREIAMQRVRDAIGGNDIRYRGPLSYRHLRILAWIMTALSVSGTVLTFAYRVIPDLLPIVNQTGSTLQLMWNFAVPLFMLANFAVILTAQDGYVRLFIRFGFLSAAVGAGFLYIVYHYYFGIFHALAVGKELTDSDLTKPLLFLFPGGFYAFNVFWDLFLFSLLSFFLYYRPKRHFRRSPAVFRLFALAPILYEVTAFVVKCLSVLHKLTIPIWLWPILPTKPPVVFLVFLILALFIKHRERMYTDRGLTHEEYRTFLGTKRNSLHFSLFTAGLFVVSALIDLAVSRLAPQRFCASSDPAFTEQFKAGMSALGVGSGIFLLPVAPVVLLFSYAKTYRDRRADILIPIFGVGLIGFSVLELIYQMLLYFLTIS